MTETDQKQPGKAMGAVPFLDLPALAKHLRKELKRRKFVLLYAYNGTGKTRLSNAFKDLGKKVDENGEMIGLPPNLFYSTGIPVCILVLKKCKKPDDVLFINAADHFVKGKRQNQLTKEHIKQIVSTYQNRDEHDRYSRRVSMKEIVGNDCNLNISRYISTAEAEKEIDLKAVHADLEAIELKINEAKERHNAFLLELGLAPLP